MLVTGIEQLNVLLIYQRERKSSIMGWLSKILGCSSSNNIRVSEGQYRRRRRHVTWWDEHTTSGGDLSDYEYNQDIDRAIALSLAEEEERAQEKDQKGKKVIDHDSQLEEDEQLAKALQESLNIESSAETPPQTPPRLARQYDQGNSPTLKPCPFFPYDFRTCSGCGAEIGQEKYLSCMGGFWHLDCFRCNSCNEPISDFEFSVSKNRPYHKLCYKEKHHPRCDVCKNFIPTNAGGCIEYREHPFWKQKYCPSHDYDETPRCCSCERMELRDTKYLVLDDGRKLCLECLDSAVVDTNECQPLYIEIQEFYEGLNMKMEQQVPLLLVERQALNEAIEGEKQGNHHLPETRGICLSEEQTVHMILKKSRLGGGHKLMDMIIEPYRLIRFCEVTAILILYGLPRLLTGTILAHEMMHAWLRLNGYPYLRPEVEEGICQVLAHMWLESEIVAGPGSSSGTSSSPSSSSSLDHGKSSSSSSNSSKKGKKSQFERKLGEFFKHQIESDSSPTYGEGFRVGNEAVSKYGLKRTLDHILLTGTFP